MKSVMQNFRLVLLVTFLKICDIIDKNLNDGKYLALKYGGKKK